MKQALINVLSNIGLMSACLALSQLLAMARAMGS